MIIALLWPYTYSMAPHHPVFWLQYSGGALLRSAAAAFATAAASRRVRTGSRGAAVVLAGAMASAVNVPAWLLPNAIWLGAAIGVVAAAALPRRTPPAVASPRVILAAGACPLAGATLAWAVLGGEQARWAGFLLLAYVAAVPLAVPVAIEVFFDRPVAGAEEDSGSDDMCGSGKGDK